MKNAKTAALNAEQVIVDQTEVKARGFVLHLAWLLPCLLIFAFFFQANFRGLHLEEAMDAAQLGRHISQGDGYTTSLLRPFSLKVGAPFNQQPELMHSPLYPLTLAVAFNLPSLSADDRTVALVSTLFGMLTAIFAYLLALRLFNRTAAGLAALFVSLNVGFLSAGTEGVCFPLLAFLVTLLALLLVKHAGRVRDSVWCGVVCGLLYLAEYALLPLLLPVVLVLGLGQTARRRAHVTACLLGFLLLAGPWLIRDWHLSGGPFSTPRARVIASFSDAYPQTSLYRMNPREAPSSLSYVPSHLRQVAKKSLRGVSEVETKIPDILESALLLLLGLALFVDLGRPEARRLRWAIFGGAGLVALGLAVGEPSYEVLYAFLGVTAALGAAALLQLLRARNVSPRSLSVILTCLLAVSAFPVVMSAIQPKAQLVDRSSLDFLKKEARLKGAFVVTDEPWSVAWYADHPALWLPQESAPTEHERNTRAFTEAVDTTRQPEFLALEKLGFKPNAIFFTSRFSYCPEEMTRWQLLQQALLRQDMNNQQYWTPPGWKLISGNALGELLLLRTEAPR